MRRVVVGFSGGVTSAWCAGWALRNYPRDEIVLLWHDTKEEDPDTYRFLREMSAALGLPLTERSDGRSVTEVMYDENMLANDRVPFCSRILKWQPGDRYVWELVSQGVTEIIKVVGMSQAEWERRQRQVAWAMSMTTLFCNVSVRFPMVEDQVSKQAAADWCKCEMGVAPSSMYEWADHANCLGCVRAGKGYWLAVREHRPDTFEQRKRLEAEFGHTFIGDASLVQIETEGMKRNPRRKERIVLGPCSCGD